MKDIHRSRRTSHGSFIVDSRGTILGFDTNMEELTGWSAIDVVGRNKDLSFVAGSDRSDARPMGSLPLYEGCIPTADDTHARELTVHSRGGTVIEADTHVHRLAGGGERALVTVLRVISRSASKDRDAGVLCSDPLTGLPDADGFADRLSAAFSASRDGAAPMAVVMLDVDRLRQINDRRGHTAGDEVLERLAGILRVAIPDETCLARLGDDDFAVVLEGAGRGTARQIAAGLRSTVERYRFFGDSAGEQMPQVTLSLGAASFPADADTEHELVERAREALDEARSMGRNRVWCYLRRPRVPLQVPVFYDSVDPLPVGYTRDLSPSGIFLQTSEAIDVGMRCALAFALPGHKRKVHVVGRVVRTVLPEMSETSSETRVPGLGVEFERFGGESDRRAIEAFLHRHEASSQRPENGRLSVPGSDV